jgi:integrase
MVLHRPIETAAYSVQFPLSMSNLLSGFARDAHQKRFAMPGLSLYDKRGSRKYLTASERQAFANAASRYSPATKAFCLTLLYTGARVSEVLALTIDRIDNSNNAIVVETLKRRHKGVFRALPVPPDFI